LETIKPLAAVQLQLISPFSLSSMRTCIDFEAPSDTKAAILFLKSVVPLSKFEGKIPAIILKHQIYCVVKDKTLVDRQLVSFIAQVMYL